MSTYAVDRINRVNFNLLGRNEHFSQDCYTRALKETDLFRKEYWANLALFGNSTLAKNATIDFFRRDSDLESSDALMSESEADSCFSQYGDLSIFNFTSEYLYEDYDMLLRDNLIKRLSDLSELSYEHHLIIAFFLYQSDLNETAKEQTKKWQSEFDLFNILFDEGIDDNWTVYLRDELKISRNIFIRIRNELIRELSDLRRIPA